MTLDGLGPNRKKRMKIEKGGLDEGFDTLRLIKIFKLKRKKK